MGGKNRVKMYAVIFHKDMDELKSNPLITIPLFLLPMVMAVIMPVVTLIPVAGMNLEDYTVDVSKIQNASIHSPIPLESLTPKQLLIVLVLNAFIPFFMVIPAVIPSVIAAHSFVGEKNARTIEVLLATPITERDLLLGKVLSAFLPSVAASYISFGLFSVTVDILTHPIFGTYIMPDFFWLVSVGLLTPLIATLSIMSNVLISTKVHDVRAAQQLGSLVVVPVIVVFVLSTTRILEINLVFLYLFAGVVALLDFVIGFVAIKTFGREKMLLGRW
ncbi:MAG: ABC transporter permease subunit [Thermoplasmata archaeon]|nr:ABC transporter permease subunit [Thermoplasmata archaeon]